MLLLDPTPALEGIALVEGCSHPPKLGLRRPQLTYPDREEPFGRHRDSFVQVQLPRESLASKPEGRPGSRRQVVLEVPEVVPNGTCTATDFLDSRVSVFTRPGVSANARRTTAGARKPSRSINHCWL